MKKKIIRTLVWTGSIFVLLVAVLIVHIYIVTRPKAADASTVVMARVDLKQPINNSDAANISQWFYAQKGVDRIVCNASMDNIVFTFHPAIANANDIVSRFKAALRYDNAVRFIPSEKDLESGCPVAATSYTYKIYRFIKNIF